MILTYIMDLIVGGLTGYATNNIAIRMLFKKLPIINVGGVIADRYEDFIKNMSELVEKDLINHETLMNELNSDKFKEVLKKIITDTIKIELPHTSGEVTIASLPGIDSCFENIESYIQTNLDSLIITVMEMLKDKSLADIISEEQFDYILNNPTQAVFANLNCYESDINKMVYTFLSKQSIHELISDRTINKLTDNIIELINNTDFSNYDDLMNKSYSELLEIINIDEIVGNFEAKLKQMKLADFVNNSNDLSRELLKRLVVISNSKDGTKLLSSLIDNVLDELENISMNLNQLLDEEFLNSLEEFILSKLPSILEQVIDLISSSKSEIELIVNEAIDQELDKGFFYRLIKPLIKLFFKNIAEKFSIVDKISVSVEEYGEKAPAILTNTLITYLRSNSISDIVKNSREQNLINSSMLTSLLQRNIQDLTVSRVSFIDDFLDKQIGELFSFDLAVIKQQALPYLFEIYKSNYLYSDKFKDTITKKVISFIDKNRDIKLANFLNKQDINLTLEERKVKDFLREEYTLLSSIKVADFTLTPKFTIDFTKQWQEIKQLKLNYFYSKINNEKSFTVAEKAIYDLIQNNLKNVLKNNISAIAKSELSKSNPEEISAMVEEFMGKELKPINIIGAVLGAIMSVGYTGITTRLPNPDIYLYSSFAVYGLAGWLTNKIAIWMLFEPYTPWIKHLPFKSPFVGVVPAQKPKFAKNLSTFVKTNLLSDTSIKELYYKERGTALESLTKLIADNNYALIDVLLQQGDFLEKLTGFTFQELQNLTKLDSSRLAHFLTTKIKSSLEESLDESLPYINKWFVDRIYSIDYTEKIENFSKEHLFARKIGNNNALLLKLFDAEVGGLFDNIVDELNYDKLIKVANNYKKEYRDFVSENSVNDIASKSFADSITQRLIDFIHNFIDQDTLAKLIISYLNEQQFNPNNKLSELFDGIFPDLLKKNISYLRDIVIQEIEVHKEEIKASIKSELFLGESKVSPVIDNLIANKLPQFLETKESDILAILLPILDYRLGDLGFNEQTLNLDSLKQNIRETLNNHDLRKSISKVAKELITDIADMPLDELLKIINIKNLRDAIVVLSPLLKYLLEQISDKIDYSSQQIASLAKTRGREIISDTTANKYYKDLLKEVNLPKEINRIISIIKSDEELKNSIHKLSKDILYRFTQNKDFYNDEILSNDLEKFINELLENDSANLKEKISPFIKDTFLNANSLISAETKKELLSYLLKSVFDSLGNNLNQALSSIDIEKVVNDEINNMEPKEIKDLFNSFAKDYFSKLVKYGAYGAIPGAIVMVIKILLK